MNKQLKLRFRILASLLIFMGLVCIYRLVVIQVIHGETYRAKAEGQYTKIAPIEGAGRANIYFTNRDGERVTAAATKQGYTLAAVSNTVEDANYIYERISQIVSLDKEVTLARLNKDDPYEELATQLSLEQAEKIRDLHIKSLRLVPTRWRYYPSGSLAAQTVGFVGYDRDGGLVGRYGLERSHEDTLRESGGLAETNIFASIFQDPVPDRLDTNEQAHILTTLDPEAEATLNTVLNNALEKWSAESVGGIVLRPDTGEIVAMESLPTFDLNNYGQADNFSVFQNPLIEHVFEMGSIVKPLVLAAAVDAGKVSISDTYNDTGSVTVRDYTISNYDGQGRGVVTLKEVLAQSLNTGMVHVGEQIGLTKLRSYFEKFELTEPTNILLPNEATPLTKNLEKGGPVELANITFGQGIAVSPLAMARSLSVLANNGQVPIPHVVKGVETLYGEYHPAVLEEASQPVLLPATVEEITRVLVYAVDEYINKAGRLSNYSVAAKTGTAQIPNPSGGYYGDRNLHSFFGYFPAYDPEFLVFLYVQYPKGAKYSSQTLTEPFFDLAEFLVSYYDVPPDRAALSLEVND